MKKKAFFLLTTFLLLFTCITMEAKVQKQQDVYVFGFSASFTDSVVYITDIQKLDYAWIDTKGNHLMEREEYAYQLKRYLADQLGTPHRTCVVFYAKNRKKAEKQFLKMKKLYTIKAKNKFDVKYLSSSDFSFTIVEVETTEQN